MFFSGAECFVSAFEATEEHFLQKCILKPGGKNSNKVDKHFLRAIQDHMKSPEIQESRQLFDDSSESESTENLEEN